MLKPLCVDLDGTLVNTDTLWETVLLFIKQRPCTAWFLLIFWLFHSRSYLKRQVAQSVNLSADALPYNQQLLSWLKEQHALGRSLVLVTAADESIAMRIAAHLGIFNHVFASDGIRNLKGSHKADILNEAFGKGQYDYVGNHRSDLEIWLHCRYAILANFSAGLLRRCREIAEVREHFPKTRLGVRKFLKAIRVHQYAKNILIFLPVLLGHYFTHAEMLWQSLLGFMCFSMLASSVYLLNDLLDLEADRRHASKSRRALACGELPIPVGIILLLLFLLLAVGLSFLLPRAFQCVMLMYYVLTMLYSFTLKRQVLLDVLALSALYTLRIIAGMAIAAQIYAFWLILFSVFFFTSLAFIKRFTELDQMLRMKQEKTIHGRGYHTDQVQMISVFGIASGYLSVLVFALYINSQQAYSLYHHPSWLYLICPVLLYWISYVWLRASSGELHEDPIIFALHDKISYYCVGLIIILATFAAAL